jgi:hypothetical protein
MPTLGPALEWPRDGYGFPLPAGIRDLYEGNDRLFS